MGFGKGLILSAISFLLIISLSLAITLYSAGILLHSEVYKSSLEKNNFYSQFGNELENESKQAIDSSLESFLSYIRGNSDSVGDLEFLQVSGMDSSKLEQVKSYVNISKRVFYGSIAASFILIILIFLVSRDFFSSAKIFGADLFLVGISTIISVIAAKPILNNTLSKNAGQEGFEFIKNLVSDLFSGIFAKMNFFGYLTLGVGAIIFVAFWFLKRRNAPKTEETKI